VALFETGSVHISAKTDYALRATVELATHRAEGSPGSLTAQAIAEAQSIPLRFLLNILADLRRGGLVESRRGPGGGWRLARPAELITVADVIRGVDGPLTSARTALPGTPIAEGISLSLSEMWGEVRTSIRALLEQVSIADLATGRLPSAKSQRPIADADAG
jgi:Rrf2 family protein